MIAAEVMVPCMSVAPNCRMDWAAISAIGGWIAAIVTFVAVLLPFLQLRKELRNRTAADDVDADIVARGSSIALVGIYSGLYTICKGMSDTTSAQDVRSAITVVRTHIAPNPLPEFPRSPKFTHARRAIANLGASLAGLISYVAVYEDGAIDDEIILGFKMTANICRMNFEVATREIDKVVDGLGLETQLRFDK